MMLVVIILAGQFIVAFGSLEDKIGTEDKISPKKIVSPLMQMKQKHDETAFKVDGSADISSEDSTTPETRDEVNGRKLKSPLDQMRQKLSKTATHECPPCKLESGFTRRLIRQILPDIENLKLGATEENQEITMHLTLSPYEVDQLLMFMDSTDSENSRRIQEILHASVSFVGVNTHGPLSLLLDNLFPDRNYLLSVLTLLTCSLFFSYLILRFVISKMTRRRFGFLAVFFFLAIDWSFTFIRLYYEEMANTVTLMERNVDSCSKDGNVLTKITNFITRSDRCLDFNRAVLVNIIWKVSPGKILAESFGSSVVVLAGNVGASFQAATSQVSWWLLPFFLGFFLVLAALYWGISIRAPLGFAIQFGGTHHHPRNPEYIRDRNRGERADLPGGIEDLPIPRIKANNPNRKYSSAEVQTLISQPAPNACFDRIVDEDHTEFQRPLPARHYLEAGAGDNSGEVLPVIKCQSGVSVEAATQTYKIDSHSSTTQTDVNYFLDEDENFRQEPAIRWNIQPLSPDSINTISSSDSMNSVS